mgnify:CR=1 FL=1
MIAGIGIDTVSISRFEKLIERYGARFLEKVFTDSERAEGGRRVAQASFFAARFAAREAFYKALGTGWGRGLPLKEVSVITGEGGRPALILGPRMVLELEERGISHQHVSLTHDGDSAVAIVILETN